MTPSSLDKPIGTSEDYIRLAILEFEQGRHSLSWQHASQALLLDSSIEKRKRPYGHYLERIIKTNYSGVRDFREFINKFRSGNRRHLKNLVLSGWGCEETLEISGLVGRIKLILFFDPDQEESLDSIRRIKEIEQQFTNEKKVVVLYVACHQPADKGSAAEIARKSDGFYVPLDEQLKPELCAGEPTIWIVDQNNAIVYRHQGSASFFQRHLPDELTSLDN